MIPLHVHTEYSFLDGMIRIPELIRFAQNNQLPAVAVTDHGELGGLIELALAAKSSNIHPIFGMEAYHVPNVADRDRDPSHLTLWARNQQGLRNLYQLSSKAYLRGFYQKPRVDWKMLEEHHEGLWCGSGCLAGMLPRAIDQREGKSIKETIAKLKELFGGVFFLELMTGTSSKQKFVNMTLLKLGDRYQLPLLITNDSHYVARDDFKHHEMLLAIQTKKSLKDPQRLSFKDPDYFLHTEEDVWEALPYIPVEDQEQAILNTYILDQYSDAFPQFEKVSIPSMSSEPEETLEGYCLEGLYQKVPIEQHEVYQQRYQQELQVIREMGFTDYMLLVKDLIDWCKGDQIRLGPSRGSVAGSLVAYLSGITTIDPLKYNLWFERFINPGRKKLPDVDIDVQSSKREIVKKYLSGRYGDDQVSNIGSFSRLRWKAAIKDVARSMDQEEDAEDLIHGIEDVINASSVEDLYADFPLSKALEDGRTSTKIKKITEQQPELFEHVLKLEGLIRQPSRHAAGVVISGEPLMDVLPLRKRSDVISTQFDYRTVEALGFLKLDILGLRNLDTLEQTIQQIGLELPLEDIPLDDSLAWDEICSGDDIGLFQLDAGNMRDLVLETQPRYISELSDVIALYRPGPIGSGLVGDYIRRKQGREQISYLIPQLELLLASTQGVFIYQEQIIQTCVDLAGFTPAEAEDVRAILGKGNIQQMDEAQERFVQGCITHDISEDDAAIIFSQMRSFGTYSFNRAHSISYAIVTYYTAWFRAHYPVEYLVALLNTDRGDIARYLQECRRKKIELLPPSVSKSQQGYGVEDGKVREGLEAKFVSEQVIEHIANLRPFANFEDFMRRINHRIVNKRAMLSLIGIGALDDLPIQENLFPTGDTIREAYSQWRREVLKRKDQDIEVYEGEWEDLREEARDCNACMLRHTCSAVVFGEGSMDAKIMLIGRDPGKDEVQQERPFVGAAGLILRQVLKEIGLDAGQCYITNITKCRPPDNKFPGYGIARVCTAKWLSKELELLQPQVIVTLGNEAMKMLVGVEKITTNHGVWRPYGNGIFTCQVMSTFHPAAMLHTDQEKANQMREAMVEDLKLAAQRISEKSPRNA